MLMALKTIARDFTREWRTASEARRGEMCALLLELLAVVMEPQAVVKTPKPVAAARKKTVRRLRPNRKANAASVPSQIESLFGPQEVLSIRDVMGRLNTDSNGLVGIRLAYLVENGRMNRVGRGLYQLPA